MEVKIALTMIIRISREIIRGHIVKGKQVQYLTRCYKNRPREIQRGNL